MGNNNVTISFIAEVCGVSRQTVSRVINNNGYVKEETRNIVEKALKIYDYKPNIYAQSLSGKKTKKNRNIILSIKSNLKTSATMWLNMLINKIISSNTYENTTIIIEQYYNEEDIKRSLINTTKSFVDGVIIFYEEKDDERIKILKKSNIPYIVYGKAYDSNDICVGLDNEQSMMMVIDHLFSKNKKKITYISSFPSPMNTSREEAIKKAYVKNNVSLNLLKIIKNVKNIEQLYGITTDMVKANELPEVIFVAGDEKAIGVLNALKDLNIKIPKDVSVVGLDNIPISKYLMPPLTTIGYDYDKIGEIILKKINNMIDGNIEESIYFEGILFKRESSL